MESVLMEKAKFNLKDVLTIKDFDSGDTWQSTFMYTTFMENEVYSEVQNIEKVKEVVMDIID